jgi:hypothetical protein
MNKTPAALAQYSLFFLTAVLTAFGVSSIFRAAPDATLKIFYMAYGVLAFGEALAMLFCGLFIRAGKPAVFWFTVVILSLNILLSIFDQFGWVDLLFVLLNAATLGLILNLRKELTPQ